VIFEDDNLIIPAGEGRHMNMRIRAQPSGTKSECPCSSLWPVWSRGRYY
jgi:hypothetical protein